MLLVNSVQTLGVEDVALAEAVIENSEAGPQHGLGGLASSQSPGNADARGKVSVVADVILRFESQPGADGQIGARLPVVLHVGLEVKVAHTGKGVSGNEA